MLASKINAFLNLRLTVATSEMVPLLSDWAPYECASQSDAQLRAHSFIHCKYFVGAQFPVINTFLI